MFFESPTLVRMGVEESASQALRNCTRIALLAAALPLAAAFAPPALGTQLLDSAGVVEVRAKPSDARGTVQRLALRKSKRVIAGYAPRSAYQRPSVGQASGLRRTPDSLDLKSSAALVVDQETNQVLFSKNADAVLPIASLTKLMTAVVIAESKLPMDELIAVTQDDVDTEKGSRSRLKVGTQLTRADMLHLALMASENRAAHTLGRTFPGGSEAFVASMNAKAGALGMRDTLFVESTGLSSRNRSSAQDLATLARAAMQHPLIRDMSVSPRHEVEVGRRSLRFHNTNRLVQRADWEIGLQKTGYISEAGRCLVMQATLAGRSLIMVFLDSAGKHSRLGDAERVRRWVSESAPAPATPSLAGGNALTS